VAAVDLFRIVGQADRADHRALLQRLVGTLDLEVLDKGDGIAVGQNIAGGIANLGGLGGGRCHLRGRAPFTGHVVIDIVVIVGCHGRLSSSG